MGGFVPFFRTRNRRLHCTWRTLNFLAIVNGKAGICSQQKVVSVIIAIEYEYEYRLTPEYEYELMTKRNLHKAQITATPMY